MFGVAQPEPPIPLSCAGLCLLSIKTSRSVGTYRTSEQSFQFIINESNEFAEVTTQRVLRFLYRLRHTSGLSAIN